MTPKLSKFELDRKRCSPLSNRIKALAIPLKFKNPSLHQYNGKERITLKCLAQRWYLKLSPRSIDSWKDLMHAFGNQFSPSRQCQIEPNDLVDVTQQEDESLKDYIHWCLEASAKTKILSKDARVMELATGLNEMSPLWSDLCLKSVYTMNDFLDRLDGFINLEEVVTQAKGSKGNKKKSPNSLTLDTTVQVNGKKRDSNGGKRANNSGKLGNFPGGKKAETRGRPIREYEPHFTTYSIILAPRDEIYTTTQSIVSYRKLILLKELGKRDINKFCCYHNNYDHDTNDCNQLRDEIEFLIRQKLVTLQKYVHLEAPVGGNAPFQLGLVASKQA
ncbi:hypothetical protein CsatB_023176 [Cannabis sativa]